MAVSIEYRPGQPGSAPGGRDPAPWAVVRDGRVVARYYSREFAEWSADLNRDEEGLEG